MRPLPPKLSGSGHRKRKHEDDAARLGRRRSSFKGKRRRTHAGDGNRRWTFSSHDLSAYRSRFVIVSYNILGVENALKHSDLYHKVSPENLDWGRRKRRICRELNTYKPSVLCFQEVDRYDDLADDLHKDGYIGIYKGRTGDAKDGCAIFWKEEQFSLLHQEDIEYRRFGLRDNVAQLCVLKVTHNHSKVLTCKDTECLTESDFCRCASSQIVVVGNIHVLFNPNRGDIKLGQIRLLLERSYAVSQQWGNAPVVLCGDLNSMPQSALYKIFSSPQLDILTYDRKKVSGQIEVRYGDVPSYAQINASRSPFGMPKQLKYRWTEEEISLAVGSKGCTYLNNPLQLFSAYQGVPGCSSTRDGSGEPLATSYHSKFMGTVDYIWHSAKLIPVGVVETLPMQTLKKLGGLPSKKWGSDHLALVCELAFVDDANLAKTPHIHPKAHA